MPSNEEIEAAAKMLALTKTHIDRLTLKQINDQKTLAGLVLDAAEKVRHAAEEARRNWGVTK